MQVGLRSLHREKCPVSDGALLFVFFAAGAAAAFFGSVQAPVFADPRLFFCGLMVCVLLLSPSGFGCMLLPFCALALGFAAERSAVLLVDAWFAERCLELLALIPWLVLTPLFFLASTHGMTASAAVQTALQRSSPTARLIFRRELSRVFVFVLLAHAAILYFY